jgi:preprotein translocase SecF subunit
MIFKISKDIKFSNFYKKMNIFSSILIFLSILALLFKGLNLGVDFKGGTLIEVRTENSKSDIAEIRQSLLRMNLGDVTVKKFGKEQDYLVKIEMTKTNDMDFIQSINEQLSSDLGSVVNFRRVENVGPKVSNELLKAGLLAISLSLAAMLFYIWVRFEWQFSLAAIVALIHDVIITVGIFSILSYEVNL